MDGLMREFRAIEDEMRDKVVRLKRKPIETSPVEL
jgi:hypothetical protein